MAHTLQRVGTGGISGQVTTHQKMAIIKPSTINTKSYDMPTATSVQWTISITLRSSENRLSAMQPMQIWQVLAQWVTEKHHGSLCSF